MSEVVFFTLRPDGHFGSPEINTICPPDQFPDIPNENEIFNFWSNAIRNKWQTSTDEFKSEEDAFYQYGDSGMYYAIYLLILENKSVLELLEKKVYHFWPTKLNTSPIELAEWFKKQKGVEEAFAITRN